ncbi:MAG: DUF5069 domain-containing protein [Nitrospirales bacterium]
MVAPSETPPTQDPQDWKTSFQVLYSGAVEQFQIGVRGPEGVFSEQDATLLANLGANPQEIYDFVEDWVEDREPDPETVLAITEVRRDFFLKEQDGQRSSSPKPFASFPPRNASLGGFTWLPRIIGKAEAKLRGELPQDLMYGCGADRPFLRGITFHPAEFLRLVWEAHGQEDRILAAIQQRNYSSSQ